MLSKKKKEKKKKLSSRPAEDPRAPGQDRADRYRCGVGLLPPLGFIVCLLLQSSGTASLARHPPSEAQHLGLPVHEEPPTDHPGGRPPVLVLLPTWALPSGLRVIFVFQEVKQYYEEYQQLKQQQREEAEAVQELTASKHFGFLGNRSDPLIGCTGGVSELSDFLSHLLMSRLSRGEEAKGQEAKGGVSRL